MTELYIFDADGTLRYTTRPGQPCPNRDDEWRLMPNVAHVLRAIDWSAPGAAMGIASNQNGVGHGYVTAGTARRLIEDAVRAALGQLPARLDVEMCTCHSSAACARRKPSPGMLQRILERFGVDPAAALFVGDLDVDHAAAVAAGVPFAWAADFFHWKD
jgi:histidinol-phosphate phosphatase family protein